MKKILFPSLLITAGILASVSTAQAGINSLSMGYAQSRVEHFEDLRGINLKYRYETEMPVGVITSFSYLSGDKEHFSGFTGGEGWRQNLKFKQWSLLAGPALRVNKFASLYALVGAGSGKAELKLHNTMTDEKISKRRTGFAWGAGVQFNPMNNVVIDVGYEGNKIDNVKLNGFNIGVGYRF